MDYNKTHIIIIDEAEIKIDKRKGQTDGSYLLERAAIKANRLGNEKLKVLSVDVDRKKDGYYIIKFNCEYDPLWSK